jgi:hypothetical protein
LIEKRRHHDEESTVPDIASRHRFLNPCNDSDSRCKMHTFLLKVEGGVGESLSEGYIPTFVLIVGGIRGETVIWFSVQANQKPSCSSSSNKVQADHLFSEKGKGVC